jgi:hypothetical protein
MDDLTLLAAKAALMRIKQADAPVDDNQVANHLWDATGTGTGGLAGMRIGGHVGENLGNLAALHPRYDPTHPPFFANGRINDPANYRYTTEVLEAQHDAQRAYSLNKERPFIDKLLRHSQFHTIDAPPVNTSFIPVGKGMQQSMKERIGSAAKLPKIGKGLLGTAGLIGGGLIGHGLMNRWLGSLQQSRLDQIVNAKPQAAQSLAPPIAKPQAPQLSAPKIQQQAPKSSWLGNQVSLRKQNMQVIKDKATQALSGLWDRMSAHYGGQR